MWMLVIILLNTVPGQKLQLIPIFHRILWPLLFIIRVSRSSPSV